MPRFLIFFSNGGKSGAKKIVENFADEQVGCGQVQGRGFANKKRKTNDS